MACVSLSCKVPLGSDPHIVEIELLIASDICSEAEDHVFCKIVYEIEPSNVYQPVEVHFKLNLICAIRTETSMY